MCAAIVVRNTHRQISENSLRNGDLLTRSRARITNNQTDLQNVLYKVLNDYYKKPSRMERIRIWTYLQTETLRLKTLDRQRNY
jgi:hypothetical protein